MPKRPSKRLLDLLKELPISEDCQKVIAKVRVEDLKVGDLLPDGTSSYIADGYLVITQYNHVKEGIKARPGLHNIQYNPAKGMILEETKFLSDSFLDQFDASKEITTKIDKFFQSLDKYKKHNIFPKRGFLLYGPPGCSKSATISKISEKYSKEKDTLIINWKTFKFRSNDVFDLLKRITYGKEVKKLVLIMEDIGGEAAEFNPNRSTDSTLLSILDNVDQIYKVPTVIIATTNFPENLLENLTDRPSRFDEVISFQRPSAEMRAEFLKFFAKESVTEEALQKIKQDKFSVFSIAHIKEVFLRSELSEISLVEAIDQIYGQSKKVTNSFKEVRKGVGLVSFDD